MSPDELAGRIVTGEFVKRESPEFTAQYLSLIERVRGQENGR